MTGEYSEWVDPADAGTWPKGIERSSVTILSESDAYYIAASALAKPEAGEPAFDATADNDEEGDR